MGKNRAASDKEFSKDKNAGGAKKLRGADGFESHYSSLYGARWAALKAALLEQSQPSPLVCQPGAPAYYLDAASVVAAMTLPLEGAKNILDMCAAPGGKSLVLASRMDSDANILCNERSFDRSMRLRKVISEHLPTATQERVQVSCGDGALLCKKQTEAYDAILLDAPCSSERHVLNDSKYLAEWSPARVKSLAMQEWALLSSAFRLLKTGGRLLYSTCALDPAENTGVCERLIKKFPNAAAAGLEEVRALQSSAKSKMEAFFDVSQLPDFEPSGLGFSILPDAQKGAGPIFFCLLKKK